MIKLHPLFVAIMAALMCVSVAQAAETKEEESSPSNSIELIGYRGGVTAKAYLEHEVTENLVVFLSAANSKGFDEVTVGPAYYITPELQVGISAGVARYAAGNEDEKSSHSVALAFVYYKSDSVEAEVTAEKYGRDPEPWYYQTYVQWSVGGNWFAGVYGEADVGWGPRISWAFHKNASVWAAPIIEQLGDDKNKIVGGVAIAF